MLVFFFVCLIVFWLPTPPLVVNVFVPITYSKDLVLVPVSHSGLGGGVIHYQFGYHPQSD